jgi:hypothetical protein
MHRRFGFAIVAGALLAGAVASAQDSAPRGTASATINSKKVTIDYGRPALKGRKLDALLAQLSEDRIWRAGENEVTTLTTETDLMIGGKRVPAGKYSVYVHAPATGDWSLVLNKDPGIALVKLWAQAPPARAQALWPRLDGYKNVADKEVVRAAMKSGKPASTVEQFTIDLAPAAGGATLTLSWGDRKWALDLEAAK